MNENVRGTLEKIVVDISGHKKPLKDSLCLYHDLRISGDDAWELLEKVKKTFGTRFDELHFDAYFPNEGEALGYWLSALFGFKDKLKRLTFGHLMEVVKVGHWLEPEP